MIGLSELAVLFACAVAAWLVWDTMRARETANEAMRAACERSGYLFLDDTVSLASVRPARDRDGRLRLARVYTFQYSDTGHNRRDGSITLLMAEGKQETIAKDDIDEMYETKQSSMPDNLAGTMAPAEFLDVVEYLTTLK